MTTRQIHENVFNIHSNTNVFDPMSEHQAVRWFKFEPLQFSSICLHTKLLTVL